MYLVPHFPTFRFSCSLAYRTKLIDEEALKMAKVYNYMVVVELNWLVSTKKN